MISAPTVLSMVVCGSFPCFQKAHGVMVAAKSPYSGYRALSWIASRRYRSGSCDQVRVSAHMKDHATEA
ncbi:hypothetical protein ACFTXM_05140 [Streptomyces sp. NPDC056930]|uniref:hypothetical protein n=1 Tax=Streptomyces sp. NPDC056930 TaxID=3345967 RepID=UPI00362E8CAA